MKRTLLASGAALALVATMFVAPASAQRGDPSGGGRGGGGGAAAHSGGGSARSGGGGAFHGGGGGGAIRGGSAPQFRGGVPGAGAGVRVAPQFNGGRAFNGGGQVRTGQVDCGYYRRPGVRYGFVPGPSYYGGDYYDDTPYYYGDDECYQLQPVQTPYGVQYQRVWVCD